MKTRSDRPRRAAGGGRALAAGFTLLEVMVAVSILAVSLTAVFSTEVQNVRMGNHAKWITQADLLARCKMSELELELRKNGFPEADEGESGEPCCEISESKDFACSWEVKQVELPSTIDVETAIGEAMNKDSLSSFIGDFQAERINEQLAEMGGMGVLAALIPMINELLKGTIRRIDLTVQWKEHAREEKLQLSQFVINPEESAMAPLMQMGIMQDLINGVKPQNPLNFDELTPFLKPPGGGGGAP